MRVTLALMSKAVTEPTAPLLPSVVGATLSIRRAAWEADDEVALDPFAAMPPPTEGAVGESKSARERVRYLCTALAMSAGASCGDPIARMAELRAAATRASYSQCTAGRHCLDAGTSACTTSPP